MRCHPPPPRPACCYTVPLPTPPAHTRDRAHIPSRPSQCVVRVPRCSATTPLLPACLLPPMPPAGAPARPPARNPRRLHATDVQMLRAAVDALGPEDDAAHARAVASLKTLASQLGPIGAVVDKR